MSNQRVEFEVAVVGAGPAGIAAACVAAEAHRSVAVIDNTPWLGGQIWRGTQAHALSASARHWLERFQKAGVRLFSNCTVFATPSAHLLLAETAEGVLELNWKKLIVATGARERFLPFPGWTMPGVMGPAGLHAMAKSGWPVAGKRIVVAGSGPLLLAVADGFKQAGARVSLVAEQAPWGRIMRFGLGLVRYPGKLLQGIGVKSRLLDVPYRCGCWPVKAEGGTRVERVTLTDGSRSWSEECDYLACGFHLIPNLELPRLLGCTVSDGVVTVNEFQMTSVTDVFCAGEPTGIGGAECALVEGQVAGLAAVAAGERARALFAQRAHWHGFRAGLQATFSLRPELRRLATPETLVCRCEDVPLGELTQYKNWREAKLHSRCGMGSCQGRTCGGATEFLFGWNNESVRPPLFPVRVASLAAGPSSPETHTSEPKTSLHT